MTLSRLHRPTPDEPPSRLADPMLRRYLAIGLACWAAGAVVILLAATGITDGLDRRTLILAETDGGDRPWLTDIMRVATFLGDWPARLGIAGLFVLMLLARRFARAASYILYTTLAAWALNAWVLKPLLDRERPPGAAALPSVGDPFSLPSGHASNAAALAMAIAIVASVIWWRRHQRRAIWVTALAFAALVGVSRVWLGAHWATDVLAGWLEGVGVALLMAVWLRPVRSRAATGR